MMHAISRDRSRRLVLAGIALFTTVSATAPGAPIEIAVTNVTSAKGRVHVEMCSQKAFLTNDCLYFASAPSVIGTTLVTIPALPPGRYAAQAYQDLNGNNKIDRNFLGIPREPVGFSNDAPIRMAPPRFADAAVDHGATPQRISFRLRSIF